MISFSRWLKHLCTTRAMGRRAFPETAMESLETVISKGETLHRAEMRLIVEHALPYLTVLRGTTSRQRAAELFAHYRIWDTEDNCGVLIYVNLADRKVEIIADRDVARRVTQAEWDAVCATMAARFADGDFHEGTAAALKQLNALLQLHYPAQGNHANQLPNKPVIL